MFDRIAKIVAQECKLTFDRPVLAAVSGGPDSLCLFDILHRLGYPITIAHLDHKIRAEAADEAQTLDQLAKALNVPICLGKADVISYAREQSLSVEEAARVLRYQFLFQQAALIQAQAVVTGHTADDQVETVLMHLLRGSGLGGLQGMNYCSLPNPWSDTIPLIRPLLGVWRQDITAYLRERGLVPFEDPTNRDSLFFRNRIRHELIPILESYNPKVRPHIWRTAFIVQEDLAIIEQVVVAAWEACLREKSSDWCTFYLPAIRSQPEAIIRHLLRRAAQQLKPALRDIDFGALQRGCQFIHQPPHSRQCDWIGGLRLRIQDDLLWVARWDKALPSDLVLDWPQMATSQPLLLTIPGMIVLTKGWQLKAEVVPNIQTALEQARRNTNPFEAWISADGLAAGLLVRRRQPGDALQPLGMNGHSTKISDLMINQKIHRAARSGWPVLVSGKHVVWLPGLHLADPFKFNSGQPICCPVDLQFCG